MHTGAENRPIVALRRPLLKWTFVAEYGTLAAFVTMCLVLSAIAPGFLTFDNILTILRQISVLGIISLGMTLVMASGGIDLSIGEALDAGALVSISLIAAGFGAVPSILGGLAGGLVIGAINGLLVAGFGVMPFLATLGVHSMVMSLEMVYTKGGLPIYPYGGVPASFNFLGRGFIGPVPFPVVALAACLLLFYLMLHRLTLGRYVYAVGENPEASRLSGVNVRLVTFGSYVIASVVAAFAGIILASRVSSGQPLAGEPYLLDSIAAVFMGRTVSREGKASILGSLVGAAFLGTVMNGMTLLNVVFYMQTFIKGALLLGVLALASYARTRRT